MNEERSVVIRWLRAFGRFWWDFLVGDTPELFAAALIIIGVIALLSEVGHANAASVVVLPLLAIVALIVTVRRAQRASRRQ